MVNFLSAYCIVFSTYFYIGFVFSANFLRPLRLQSVESVFCGLCEFSASFAVAFLRPLRLQSVESVFCVLCEFSAAFAVAFLRLLRLHFCVLCGCIFCFFSAFSANFLRPLRLQSVKSV